MTCSTTAEPINKMGFFRFAGLHMDSHEISVARAMGLFDQIACILARAEKRNRFGVAANAYLIVKVKVGVSRSMMLVWPSTLKENWRVEALSE